VDELLDHAPCGFISFRDDGVVTVANRRMRDIVGYSADELVGRPIDNIFSIGTKIFYQTHFFPLVRMHGRADEIFLILRHADGSDVGVLANALRHERDGVTVNDCVFMRVLERQKFEAELVRARRAAEDARAASQKDQQELVRANELLEQQAVELELSAEELQGLNERLAQRSVELERLRAEADEANQAKSNFLAMMSHELRTPLNAIAGYAQLLEMGIQGPVSDSQKESLQRIQQSQRHLLRLVNEILNLARIESGRIEFDLSDEPAVTLVSRILPLIEPQMKQNKLIMQVDTPAGIVIHCDVDKTQQIILNLLSNAIKFTPEGGMITVTAAPDGAKAGNVLITVRDTGIGIPETMLNTIFDPFVQVEMSPSRRGEGTGLGLAISRDLARGMNGDLYAASKPGEGSTFYLTLPSAPT
jgi:PAS domain S-box-containing protein